MKIISYNLNGIRAAIRKGLTKWLVEADADILCLQELKAQQEDLDLEEFKSLGYQIYWMDAAQKGYSGVAILSRVKPVKLIYGWDKPEFDQEARMIQAYYKDFLLICTYFPSGSSGPHRQKIKLKWLNEFLPFILNIKNQNKHLIVSGDFNICHQPIDIHNPVSNKNSPGFTREERDWFTKFIESGFIDTFRYFHPDLPDQYTWWTYRFNARKNNKGWRIDYHIVSEEMKSRLRCSEIMDHVYHSDHCPVLLEFD